MEPEAAKRPLPHLEAARLVDAHETAQTEDLLKALHALTQELRMLVEQLKEINS
jgi:hypothetical protein